VRGRAAIGSVVALSACATTPFAPPPVVEARYRCADGTALAVRFDNRADTATVVEARGATVLRGQRPASGIWYAGEGYSLRGKGDAARFDRPDGTGQECRAG
jgi:membrane-bound inhibitor of C-type lysozyme